MLEVELDLLRSERRRRVLRLLFDAADDVVDEIGGVLEEKYEGGT